MTITAYLWDKASTINGVGVERLHEKFQEENGSTDRVLIAHDGEIARIQRVDDQEFNATEKAHMNGLISQGAERGQAIADTWLYKIHAEEEAARNAPPDDSAKLADVEKALKILLGVE